MKLPPSAKLVHVRLPAEALERLETADSHKGVTHNFNSSDLPDGGQLVAIITCGDDAYCAVAILKKESHTSTFQVRVRLKFITTITPVPFAAVRDRIDDRLCVHVDARISSEIGSFPSKSGQAVINALLACSPEIAAAFKLAVAHIEGRRKFRFSENSPWGVICQEKDAIDTALNLAGMSPSAYTSDVNGNAPPQNTFDILAGHLALEDRQIEIDAAVFGGLQAIKTDVRGGRVFFDDHAKSTVRVINVNRHSLEATLGVDLIVYYEAFRSYVMVQYKRMLPKERRNAHGLSEKFWRYYRDANYQPEVDRMAGLRRHIGSQPCGGPLDYRINDDPFYFKFCRADDIDADSRGMVKGLHVLARDVEHFLLSDQSKGEKGGHYLGYENLKRKFPNSLFLDLVRNGWIGSRSVGSRSIEAYVQSSLNARRSVVLANVSSERGASSDPDDE